MLAELTLFISYSHHDCELLADSATNGPTEFLRILQGLRSSKIKVAFDRGFLKAGDLWNDQIEQHLKQCDILVPILSDDFIQSDFCNHVEVATILARQRNGHDVLITPFYYKYCNWQAVEWIRKRDIRPAGDMPLQAISDPHLRTKAMINFRSEIQSQAALLRGGSLEPL